MRALSMICLLWAVASAAVADDHGVILVYHRIADEGPASTRLSPAQFQRHLDWLEEQGFTVLPLSQMLEGIYARGETEPNAVSITFDDAYASVYTTAFPILREREIPFSVFAATDALDKGYGRYMNWEQLAELQASGLVEVGPHSVTHSHLEQRGAAEDDSGWRKRTQQEIEGSFARLTEKLPREPVQVFAYPYGEYSATTLELVAQAGFRGLAQQSGAVGAVSSAHRIPRFAVSTGYDSLERLETALRSRPMPVVEEEAQDFILQERDGRLESFTLTLDEGAVAASAVSCFSASGSRLQTSVQGNELTVSLPPFTAGRNKINCTAGTGSAGEFYWYSRLWTVADTEGQWLQE